MDVEKFLNSLDNLFEKKKINEVPAFLEENYKEAVRENDLSAQFTILNEMMGFFRDISEYEKSIKACHQCIVNTGKCPLCNFPSKYCQCPQSSRIAKRSTSVLYGGF